MNRTQKTSFDVCIIGGGINGVGIARDCAGRGLSVTLLEKGDLGNATSSMSSKMIHGGLRYLEHYEFSLVRKALKERNVLLTIAPNLVRPLRLILPHEPYLRPAWLIRLGLLFYDFLALRHQKLKKSFGFTLKNTVHNNILKSSYKKAFSYADCWVDDSRLVVSNAMDCVKRGGSIRPHHECVSAVRKGGRWLVTVKDHLTGHEYCITAKMLVNATGPWVRRFLDQNSLSHPETPHIRLVKGSHIIVDRLYEGDHAYLLQQPDKRVLFVFPYEGKYSLIGTTEELHESDPKEAQISGAEIDYLCAAINRSFQKSLSPDDILWSYSGVRPLLEDGQESASAVTRDYKIILEEYGAPLLSVFGGKLTTYRTLAETVTTQIFEAIKEEDTKGTWTYKEPLLGGQFPQKNFLLFLNEQKKRYPWVPDAMLTRYAQAYGSQMDQILQHGDSLVGLGRHYGDDIYEKEIVYMIKHEMAYTLEDILWRRSKLGLHISTQTQEKIASALPSLLQEQDR